MLSIKGKLQHFLEKLGLEYILLVSGLHNSYIKLQIVRSAQKDIIYRKMCHSVAGGLIGTLIRMWLVCPFVMSLWENLLAVTAWCSQGNKTWCFSSLTAATYKATKDMQELLTLGKNWISVFFHAILIKPLARSKSLASYGQQ